MTNFDEIERRLNYHNEFQHGVGADADTIAAAEKSLGITFPESYRQFLNSFGWGFMGYFEIHGLGGDVPMWLDVVKMTEIERADTHARMPMHLVPVHEDKEGDLICIDTSQCVGNSAAVVFWDRELGAGQKPEKLADDFSLWLATAL